MSGDSQRRRPGRGARRPFAPRALAVVSTFAFALASALAACDRRPAPPRPDSVPPPAAPESAPPPAPAPTTTWNADAGEALLVNTANERGDAIVVVPGTSDGSPTDTAAGRAEGVLPAEVSLFSRAGAAGQARATLASGVVVDPGSDCTMWPTARLGPASGADVLPRWTVGLAGGRATPILLDSLEGLASTDSAALAAALSRVAAGLPGDTARRLRGLPFAVRSARRFAPEPGVEAVVAVLTRTLGQEATPFGEHVLLVAERPAGRTPPAPFVAAYHERSVGIEETLESIDALAAVRLGDENGGRPTLVLSREYYEGSAYTLLEREGPGRWRVRWTSAYAGC